ncbi:NAD-dependent epimerase/dehydratase family protein [bacterium]|jgi:UDP-glucose 4-epimerase|nr:NAD-dependent epimerase/dehydratase family protein [bacterium]MBT6832106.1 NAD-dependent epimerase/dehydratase family protein [bacterium]MBT6996066.1 NAD-dependent epimerase/dehydratase family protein [bacterium]MBT7772515.1 NAD-dependent epimerase/dehydratase family protein [bacterium]
MKKKVLVTGGAGFIGSNFCNLNCEKYDVVALDNLFLGDSENLNSAVKFIEGDACKLSDLKKCGEKFDAVLHLAGTSSAPMFGGDGFVDGYRNSVESFCQTLKFAHDSGAKKFLYASTSSLYGNNPMPLVETQMVIPPNHYACTKFLYEQCARCFTQQFPEIETVGFRFMSVYGPNEEAKGQFANMISQFVWDVARDESPVIFGDGEQFRDFTNVVDVVQGITRAIEFDGKLGSEIFNIGTGEFATFNEILEIINEAFGKNVSAIRIPNPVTEMYVRGQEADISKISKTLGYAPTVDLKSGIRAQVEQLNFKKIRETSSDRLKKSGKILS